MAPDERPPRLSLSPLTPATPARRLLGAATATATDEAGEGTLCDRMTFPVSQE